MDMYAKFIENEYARIQEQKKIRHRIKKRIQIHRFLKENGMETAIAAVCACGIVVGAAVLAMPVLDGDAEMQGCVTIGIAVAMVYLYSFISRVVKGEQK